MRTSEGVREFPEPPRRLATPPGHQERHADHDALDLLYARDLDHARHRVLRARTTSVSSPVAMMPSGSLTASPMRRSPQSTARTRGIRSPLALDGGGGPTLDQPARSAARLELEVHRVHAGAHDEDATATRVEQMLGARWRRHSGARVEARPGVVHP